MFPQPLITSAPVFTLCDDFARRALEFFYERTGLEATHLVYAPGRVNVIGEHTDYNGGFVLPMAIELGVYIAARPRTDRRVRAWSMQGDGPPAEFDVGDRALPAAHAWSNYLRGVIAGLARAGLEMPGFDALIHASLPPGGGLSSSAALEIAAATLGECLCGRRLDPVEKALLCQKAEHLYAGTPCGIMDQFAVTFGQRGHLLLLDCQSLERKLVPMPGAEATLLVINTMVKHELTDGGYASRRDDCYEAARILEVNTLRDVTAHQLRAAAALLPERLYRRARHVVTENARTLSAVAAIQRGAWPELGQLMVASHASLRDDFEVSCPELDAVVAAAGALGIEGGVFGCRLTGGGFGGCCVALVQTAQAESAAQAIGAAYQKSTGIEATILATHPADGPAILMQP